MAVSEAERKKLDRKLAALGFDQMLPPGAVPLANALLTELIATSEALKYSKMQESRLLEEKIAWDLGVEVYKCDSAKLLEECNNLNLQLIKERDKFELEHIDIKHTMYKLQIDKQYLEDLCFEQADRIKHLEIECSKLCATLGKDVATTPKKPFISTVRSGSIVPKGSQVKDLENRSNNFIDRTEIMHKILRLKEDNRTQSDTLIAFKNQLNGRDREIERLNAMLIGGRPVTALAQDCCYRGVRNLTEDVEQLQKDKNLMKHQLKENVEQQQIAANRVETLQDENRTLVNELRELKKLALHVESQANSSLVDRDKINSKLEVALTKYKTKITDLEIELAKLKSCGTKQGESDRSEIEMHLALKDANTEKRILRDKLNELVLREKDLLSHIDKLTRKNLKMKTKLNEIRQDPVQHETASQNTDHRSNQLKSERDYFEREYNKLMEKINEALPIEKYNQQLKQKESEINTLKNEIILVRRHSAHTAAGDSISSSHATTAQAAIKRAERERDVLSSELQQTKIERDNLRDRLKLATDNILSEQTELKERVQEKTVQLDKLVVTNNDLLAAQHSSKTDRNLLKEEIKDLRNKLKSVQKENATLQTSCNQLRFVYDTSEKGLIDYQNRLLHAETELGHANAQLMEFTGKHNKSESVVCHMRNEIVEIKSLSGTLERENDQLTINLDKKTERIHQLEQEVDMLRRTSKEHKATTDRLEAKLEQTIAENRQNVGTLRSANTESDSLKRTVVLLQRNSEGALTDNSRLIQELSDVTTELNINKRKLSDAEVEIDKLKSQLQQYVQEVERAEHLLTIKEREREEMLEQYQTLSQDAVILEDNNHSLEIETAETKKHLIDAETNLADLRCDLASQQDDLCSKERKISELTLQIMTLKETIDSSCAQNRKAAIDLAAIKEVCSKLDLEKDKLNAEVEEHSNIRQQLERENDKLRTEIIMTRSGDKRAVDSLQTLLASNKDELNQQRAVASELNTEILKQKRYIGQLQTQVNEANENANRNVALAKEYNVQLQELKHAMRVKDFAEENFDENFSHSCSKSTQTKIVYQANVFTKSESLTSRVRSSSSCSSRNSRQKRSDVPSSVRSSSTDSLSNLDSPASCNNLQQTMARSQKRTTVANDRSCPDDANTLETSLEQNKSTRERKKMPHSGGNVDDAYKHASFQLSPEVMKIITEMDAGLYYPDVSDIDKHTLE